MTTHSPLGRSIVGVETAQGEGGVAGGRYGARRDQRRLPAVPWMKYFPAERSDDLTAFVQRVMDSFLGRSVLRFIRMEGFDRCIVISAQAFTALIPLFIIVASAAPAGEEDVLSDAIINRFALTGESAAAVEALFSTPPGATSSVTFFSAFLLLYSGVAFTRRMQRMYRAAWEQQKVAMRSTVFATLGLLALIAEMVVAYGIRSLVERFPLDWLWTIPISMATGLVLWTSIPYLLLDRQVHWRRLLFAGGLSAVAMTAFSIATPIYMPELMTRYTNEFGLFGITITILGWLLAVSFVLVASAAIGAEFDASDARWLMALKVRFKLMDPGLELPMEEPEGARRGLTSGDLLALIRVLKNWLIMSAAVWIATALVPGIDVYGGFATYLGISLIIGLVNAVLGPVLSWLAGSLSWVRLGVSALLVNGILLAVTAGLSPRMDIDGFASAVLGALVLALAGTVLEMVFRPVTSVSEPT
jgi:membrane protein